MLNVTHNNVTFVPLINFEGLYWISNCGQVFNGRKVLKTYSINSGYQAIKLTKNTIVHSFLIHRLVALNFLSNPLNKKEINHINGNKSDNDVSNLEWVSSKENKLHARQNNLWAYNLPAKGVKKGKKSKYYNVSYDASRNKWTATVRHNNINIQQKRFDTEIEAARHVDYIIDTYSLNRPKNNV